MTASAKSKIWREDKKHHKSSSKFLLHGSLEYVRASLISAIDYPALMSWLGLAGYSLFLVCPNFLQEWSPSS